MIGGGVIGMIALVSIISSPPEKTERNTQKDVIKNILTDGSARETSMDALVSNVKSSLKTNQIQARDIAQLKKEVRFAREVTGTTQNFTKTLDALRADLRKQDEVNKELRKMLENQGVKLSTRLNDLTSTTTSQYKELENREIKKAKALNTSDNNSDLKIISKHDNENPFKKKNLVVYEPTKRETDKASPKPKSRKKNKVRGVQIVNIKSQPDVAIIEKQPDEPVFLPMGTIMTGRLLNGMDAPTGAGARKDPFPSTIRIDHEAILPNRYTADIRECFLQLGGYGDMSSERAYLRSEAISCVRDDGKVIETRIDGYAVGEDGKVGVRGRLVSKQGTLIARSLVAGFFSGFAEAMDKAKIPALSTNGSSGYENVLNTNTLQSGVSSGASSAMERISDFYLEMAEGMFPVIEIDADRSVDIILTRGQHLEIVSKGVK